MSTGVTGKLTTSFSLGGATLSIPSDSRTADSTAVLVTTVDTGMTDFARSLNVNAAYISMMGILSTKAVTIKTYASGVLKQTFSFAANSGLVWSATQEAVTACP